MRVRFSLSAACAALFALAMVWSAAQPPSASAGEPEYEWIVIESPEQGKLIGNDVNDNGDVVGHFETPDSLKHGFIWREEFGPTALATGKGLTDTSAVAINNNGDIAGFGMFGTSPRMVIWPKLGDVQIPPLPKGFNGSVASGINATGIVCGTLFKPDFTSQPALIRPGMEMVIIPIGLPDGFISGVANGINAIGQVLTVCRNQMGQSSTLIWQLDGPNATTGSYQPALPGLIPGGEVFGFDLNDAGVITGMAVNGNRQFEAFKFQSGVTQGLSGIGGASRGNKLNESGDTVGSGFDGNGVLQATGYEPARNLNDKGNPGVVRLSIATGINGEGSILANGPLLVAGPGGTPADTDVSVLIRRKQLPFTITKVVEPDEAVVGQTVTFTIRVFNATNGIRKLNMIDQLPVDSTTGRLATKVISRNTSIGEKTFESNERIEFTMNLPSKSEAVITIKAEAFLPGQQSNSALLKDGKDNDQLGIDTALFNVLGPRPVDVTDQGKLKLSPNPNDPGTLNATFTAKPSGGAQAKRKIKGPFYLVLTNLKGAKLINQDGATTNPPAGSPYVSNPKKSAKKGTKVKFLLDFGPKVDPNKVTFTPRVFAGPGNP